MTTFDPLVSMAVCRRSPLFVPSHYKTSEWRRWDNRDFARWLGPNPHYAYARLDAMRPVRLPGAVA